MFKNLGIQPASEYVSLEEAQSASVFFWFYTGTRFRSQFTQIPFQQDKISPLQRQLNPFVIIRELIESAMGISTPSWKECKLK